MFKSLFNMDMSLFCPYESNLTNPGDWTKTISLLIHLKQFLMNASALLISIETYFFVLNIQ